MRNGHMERTLPVTGTHMGGVRPNLCPAGYAIGDVDPLLRSA
jgi:hypothetical protein